MLIGCSAALPLPPGRINPQRFHHLERGVIFSAVLQNQPQDASVLELCVVVGGPGRSHCGDW